MKTCGLFHQRIVSIALCLLWATCFASPSPAQDAPKTPPATPAPSSDIQKLQTDYAAAQKELATAEKQIAVNQKALAALTNAGLKSGADAISSGGALMNVKTTVKDNVFVQAVLLPRKPASRIFGKEIANNYAVVQLTISNMSPTSQLVIQSVFMDYRKWALSGLPNHPISCDLPKPANATPLINPSLTDANKTNCPGQIASVESTVVRDELQNAALWTGRNWVVRGLVLAGSVASGYSFLGSQNVVSGIAGFTGNVVPGVQTFWPDQTTSQVNHVSDLGFKTNDVIAKQSSKIVYAFFPIDRFLTPGLAKIFLNTPALYFAPFEMFADPAVAKIPGVSTMIDTLKSLADVKGKPADILKMLTSSCSAYSTPPTLSDHEPKTEYTDDCQRLVNDGLAANSADMAKDVGRIQQVMSSLSLNSVDVVVGGLMTVDVGAVPASVQRVSFDSPDSIAFANSCTVQSGAIEGQFLTGGTPSLTAVDLPSDLPPAFSAFKGKKVGDFLDSITVDSDKSNDLSLAFNLQLKNPIPPRSTLHFTVSKTTAGGSTTGSNTAQTLKSADVTYTVADYTPAKTPTFSSASSCTDQAKLAKPAIAGVTASDSSGVKDVLTVPGTKLKGTVTGSGLKDATLKLEPAAAAAPDIGASITDVKADEGQTSDTALTFTFTLVKAIPAGAKVNFIASTAAGDSPASTLTVAAPPAKPAVAAAGGAKPAAAGVKPGAGAKRHAAPAPAASK
jgi:hypothetical protein